MGHDGPSWQPWDDLTPDSALPPQLRLWSLVPWRSRARTSVTPSRKGAAASLSSFRDVSEFVDQIHPIQVPWKQYIAQGTLDERQFYRHWYHRGPSLALALQRLADLKKKDDTFIVDTSSFLSSYGGYRDRWTSGQPVLLWAKYAETFGGRILSIQAGSAAADRARNATRLYTEWVSVQTGEPATVLQQLERSIDLLYPNSASFDWLTTPPADFQPGPAQEQTLREVQAALPRLHAGSLVLLDECAVPYGGRCRLAIEFLTQQGWFVAHSGYQVLLTRNVRPPPCATIACMVLPAWAEEAHPVQPPWQAYFARGALQPRAFYRTWYDRQPSLKRALQLLTDLHGGRPKLIFETGMIRSRHGIEFRERWGDGQSTLLFARYGRHFGAHVVSVDVDPAVVLAARWRLAEYAAQVTLLEGNSVAALQGFAAPIDLLYIDSADFDWLVVAPDRFDPAPAQQHALREVQAAWPKLSARALVLLDDCAIPYGGKCRLAV
eukprot:EG_transcript_10273